MLISVFDLYTIGIGPSSSHTVGPMRAARLFAESVARSTAAKKTTSVRVELYGSLGLTGKGHGSDKAVLMGLEGETPEEIDPDGIATRIKAIRAGGKLKLFGKKTVAFDEGRHLLFQRGKTLPQHSNGLAFTALDKNGRTILVRTYFSVGGGFVMDNHDVELAAPLRPDKSLPYSYRSAAELLTLCRKNKKRIFEIILANEEIWRSRAQIRKRVGEIWLAMQDCVKRGLGHDGTLPGGLKVKRRAPEMQRRLMRNPEKALKDPLSIMDWVNLYALAVNEENAAGGRVVTAPTNGAAGIIPAVLHYFDRFTSQATEEKIVEFLLTAGAIGILYKQNASISGAEVGCQGEVGVACSMAAAGLTAVLGGTNEQIENAAEIGMEHNLGLTCDPVGGLVQIPCIERNAMGAMKAINASRIALSGDGTHKVSLDRVIKTMMETGRDMQTKYKETSQGGLATNVVEC